MLSKELISQINELRREGLGWKAIAHELGISKNTAKKYATAQPVNDPSPTGKAPELNAPYSKVSDELAQRRARIEALKARIKKGVPEECEIERLVNEEMALIIEAETGEKPRFRNSKELQLEYGRHYAQKLYDEDYHDMESSEEILKLALRNFAYYMVDGEYADRSVLEDEIHELMESALLHVHGVG